jgi:putative ABC transport system permease protein
MKLHRWVVRIMSALVPAKWRADWANEWNAELDYRDSLGRAGLLRRSLGTFWDALAMQPRRFEEDLIQDLHYGFRMLLREPGFTILAIAALALGIGMNTAVFSIVNAALLEPLPYRDSHQLVRIFQTIKGNGGGVSAADYLDWKAQNQAFSQMTAFQFASSSVVTPDGLERIGGLQISSDFMPLLGVQPMLGRVFVPEEDRPSSPHVAILSHAAWMKYFGGDPKIIGKSLTVDGQSFEVVGVMDPGFSLGSYSVGLLTPLTLGDETHRLRRSERYLQIIGRLRPDVSIEAARTEMASVSERLERAYPEFDTGIGTRLIPLRDTFVGTLRNSLTVLLAAVGFVLLIACCNFANLLFSRAASRQKEVAIRLALGARRLRIVRQWLTETCLLTGLAAACGFVAATWTVRAAVPFLKSMGTAYYYPAARLEALGLNRSVMIFCVLVSAAAAIISGLIPALRSARLSLLDCLKDTGRQSGTSLRAFRIRYGLIVAQISLTLMLLTGAGLFINSFRRILDTNLGFRPKGILTIDVSVPGQSVNGFHQTALDAIRNLPGVETASMVNNPPLMGIGNGTRITLENHPPASDADINVTAFRVIGPGYFHTIGATMLRGREFTDADTTTSEPQVIINESAAVAFWRGEDPLGTRIRRGGRDGFGPFLTVAGIVRDVNINGPGSEAQTEIYFPHAQFMPPQASMSLMIRSQLDDPSKLANVVRAEVRRLDKNAIITNIRTMDDIVSRVLAPRWMNTSLLSVFAVVALLLAAIGIFGVVSYSVAQRKHEIGIRMALGAERGSVLKMILRQVGSVACIGIVIGIAATLAIGKWISSLLFGIQPTDPMTLAVAVVIQLLVVLIACYIPARRAMKVDPLIALRHE